MLTIDFRYQINSLTNAIFWFYSTRVACFIKKVSLPSRFKCLSVRLRPGIVDLFYFFFFLVPVEFKANVSYLLHNYKNSQKTNMRASNRWESLLWVLKNLAIFFTFSLIWSRDLWGYLVFLNRDSATRCTGVSVPDQRPSKQDVTS